MSKRPVAFFLDTASLADIRYWKAFGVVDGVTTNPALLAKEGGDPLAQLKTIAELVEGPISAEVTETHATGMVRQGAALAKLAKNIIIKLPARADGFEAARELKQQGVKLNITLAFHPAQALPFMLLGADYISLIVGRAEDFGLNSVPLMKETKEAMRALGTSSKLLSASIRNPNHLLAAINAGSDVITVPPSTWKLSLENPLGMKGEADFTTAWQALEASVRKPYEELGA